MDPAGYLYPSSVGLGFRRHLPAPDVDLTAPFAATLCRRNLLTYTYARKVWGARFDEQAFEVCSRCAAKAAKA